MIQAVAHVRAMRGGAQSHLILADDGHHYVVKFRNNPQHPRVLVNEWIVSRLARALRLAVPRCAALHVSSEFISRSPGLVIRCGGRAAPVAAGLAFGSRVPHPVTSPWYDALPQAELAWVANLAEFAGMLALDKWVCNCDARQAIFFRPSRRRPYRAFFIDHGFAFNAGDWTFPDSPLESVYARNAVYAHIEGWADFDPWLGRIERFRPARLRAIVRTVPPEWFGAEDAPGALVAKLITRRPLVRTLLEAVRASSRNPFTHWGGSSPAPLTPDQSTVKGAAA